MRTRKKRELLINYLETNKRWVTGAELSSVLGVSKRQIANYVMDLNTNSLVVVSSSKGYKLSPMYSGETTHGYKEYSPEIRQYKLLTTLCFSKYGMDLFDAADDLFVSSSTIESDLNSIKIKLSLFELKISKKKDVYQLVGSEENIRKFIVIELFKNNLNDFCKQFKDDCLFKDIRNIAKKIIKNRGIYVNDYSLALFCLNMCVGIKRFVNGYRISLGKSVHDLPKEYQNVASDLIDYIKTNFEISLDDSEREWILSSLFVSSTLWDPKTINLNNLSLYVEEKYIDITTKLIKKVKSNFPNTKFEDEFFVRFTIHIRNCFMQREYESYNIDTLAKRIKYDYPAIFEIAVFIANCLENDYGLSMTQSELTYIAFHICSSLLDFTDFQVTITFVYSDYWNYHKKVLTQLINCIGDKGIIKQSVSISDYVPSLYHSDLVITDSFAVFPEPYLRISSIPSKENAIAVANYVDKLYLQKQYQFFVNNFESFFDRRLFVKYTGNDYIKLIKIMCKNAENIGLINKDFFDDVLKREKLDNTTFNLVAIPHTLTVASNKTFLSVAVCDEQLSWGSSEAKVRLVVMLGINKSDRKSFASVYDFLVNLLSNNNFVLELSKSNDFDEFIRKISLFAGCYDSFDYLDEFQFF